jgi:YfiH family protein
LNFTSADLFFWNGASMSEPLDFILADWPAPPNVHARVSTRHGGVSAAPWSSLNVGPHVGDDPRAVAENRRRLLAAVQRVSSKSAIDSAINSAQWLNQVHGMTVIDASVSGKSANTVPDADAVTTTESALPIIVMTADCLPVFFCDKNGSRVAVAHAGWRGLCDGVLEATLKKFANPANVLAWLGPAIGPEKFEVGAEVRAAFLEKNGEAASCFVPSKNSERWLADIYALAALRLHQAGVQHISGGGFCTVSDKERFFSYRRDGQTGRMASVIWLS